MALEDYGFPFAAESNGRFHAPRLACIVHGE
jgi:hypothetical protein